MKISSIVEQRVDELIDVSAKDDMLRRVMQQLSSLIDTIAMYEKG